MHLRTSPNLEINRHRISTSEGTTLKLKPRLFYTTYLRSSGLLSIRVLTNKLIVSHKTENGGTDHGVDGA